MVREAPIVYSCSDANPSSNTYRCITNIAASELAEEVLPAIPSLMKLLESGKDVLMEQVREGYCTVF